MEGVLQETKVGVVAARELADGDELEWFLQENAKLRESLADQKRTSTRLEQTIRRLRAEIDRLNGELAKHRQQSGYWRSMHGRAAERDNALAEQVRHFQGEVRKLQAEQFGKRTEKQTSKDRSNSLGEPSDKPKRRRGQQAKNPAPKRRDYSHLPKREKIIELPSDQRCCSHCGQPFAEMSDAKIAEQIEIEVAAYRHELIRKRYRRTCDCPDCPATVTAPLPAKLVPKGRLGTSVWIDILLGKYHDHCPTGRLIQRLRLHGLDLAPGTIAGGLKKIEPMFEPIYQAICERNGQSGFHQADETRWMVFIDQDGKVGHRWWLWIFVGQDTVVFRLDPSRAHEVPEQHYPADIAGVLMVDRYSGYKAMAQVKNGSLLLAFCWAHVRRDFVKVGKGWEELKGWAIEWLERIRVLYALNRERLRHASESDAFAAAAAELRDQVERMRRQCETELAEPKLRGPIRKTLESLRQHWQGLTRFQGDPRIPMDNNKSERIARGPATGRKNYYGSASDWSGRLATRLFSIFATLDHWKINPRAWLDCYLQKCAESAAAAPDDVEPFLPWNLTTRQIANLNHQPAPTEFDTS